MIENKHKTTKINHITHYRSQLVVSFECKISKIVDIDIYVETM